MASATAPSSLSPQDVQAIAARLRSEISMDRYHRYTTPVGILPSVTTAIKSLAKDALVGWASKVQSEACEVEALAWLQQQEPDRGDLIGRLRGVRQAHRRLSKRAADAGTEGHKLAEVEFKRRLGLEAVTPELEHPREAHLIFAGIMEWADANHVEPVAIELPVYSRLHRYAGTLDLLAYVEGFLQVMDWKSNEKARVYREAFLQNVALRAALREHGIEAGGTVVGLPRDGQGDINPVPVPWRDLDFKAFLGLVDVHRWAESVA